ncbi:polysaccharide biosynthesis tyrosine autokinase [Pedobacter nyackensis]|uniref:polysaccharide biosynthesis tyrosine autokinase n=1 Tax=Pedobacter nyackensis TaxID=475255 RepID=UPI00292F7C21|nr:polysaccharide biosynthesis tyrosine autokinase [Pedobacter nyackensis]
MMNKEIDYLKVSRILLSRWYLLAGMLACALLIAYTYLWYCPKTYSTSGILKFEEKKPELSDLVKVMNNTTRSPASLQSEKSIIHSRNILLDAIKHIDYQISFYTKGKFRNKDLYPQKPLHIKLVKPGKQTGTESLISFKAINIKTFRLSWNAEGRKIERNFRYNSLISIHNTSFTIQHNSALSLDSTYLFRFNTPETLLERVNEGLQTTEAVKNSNIISLCQTDTNPYFAADILNAIMHAYLNYDQHQKTQSATQMIHFINTQLDFLSTEVKDAETALEKHKQHSGIMDIRISANLSLSKLSDLEAQHTALKIQEISILQLKKQISENTKEVTPNLNLEGHVEPLLSTLILNLNNLLSDKHLLLKTYTNTSIPIQDINIQITKVKNAVLQNINASWERLQKNMHHLDSRIQLLNRQTATLPATEKNLVSLGRDFEINEKVYSFLSQKKLETQVNRAAVLPAATIIEQAQPNDIPITPNQAKVYRTAVILGLLAGIIIIILLRTLTPYIYNKEIVLSATSIPIAGIIRKSTGTIDEYNPHILNLVQQRTVFAESVRALRSSINMFAPEKKSKIICITSEIAGEGKSFVALNLAGSLAMINKKVIIIGADLRRPKLHMAFTSSNTSGLSTYLSSAYTIDQIIQQTNHKNLDFINSGPIPDHPAELLHNGKIDKLISELRDRYEMILIDTAPVGMVSDAISLCCKSDINLFVIRYGKSKRKTLSTAQGLAIKYNLSNMAIVLNAFEENRLHASCYKADADQSVQHHCTDYNNYKNSGYYENEPRLNWWNIRS